MEIGIGRSEIIVGQMQKKRGMKEVMSGNLAMGVRDIVKGRKKIKRGNEHIANGK